MNTRQSLTQKISLKPGALSKSTLSAGLLNQTCSVLETTRLFFDPRFRAPLHSFGVPPLIAAVRDAERVERGTLREFAVFSRVSAVGCFCWLCCWFGIGCGSSSPAIIPSFCPHYFLPSQFIFNVSSSNRDQIFWLLLLAYCTSKVGNLL
jgi:hypothetical protein